MVCLGLELVRRLDHSKSDLFKSVALEAMQSDNC